jgi:hypothetical protein
MSDHLRIVPPSRSPNKQSTLWSRQRGKETRLTGVPNRA